VQCLADVLIQVDLMAHVEYPLAVILLPWVFYSTTGESVSAVDIPARAQMCYVSHNTPSESAGRTLFHVNFYVVFFCSRLT
jgi:hypothetical protein